MAFFFSVGLVCAGATIGLRHGFSRLTGAAIGLGCYLVLQVLYFVGEFAMDAIRRRSRPRDGQ